MIFFFKKKPKRVLGIDIGAYSIKVVELEKKGKEVFLSNYGEAKIKAFSKQGFLQRSESVFFISPKKIAKSLDLLMKEAQIQTQKAVFSLPDLATFIFPLDVEKKEEEEMRRIVIAEARKFIPLPPSEMMIDFIVLESDALLKALIFAVPKETIFKYQEIAKALNLEVLSFEPESFSLVRALTFPKDQRNLLILDIGEESTVFCFVQKGVLFESRSVNISSQLFTQEIAKKLNILPQVAENLKIKYGIEGGDPQGIKVKEVLLEKLGELVKEIENFLLGKRVDKIILSGGGANLAGIQQYFKEKLKLEVERANPFATIEYLPALEKTILEIGPSFCVAVGAAKKGF